MSRTEDSPSTVCNTIAPITPAGTSCSDASEVVVYTGTAATFTPTTTACTTAELTQADFELIKKLGAGSFGTVFLARHKGSGLRVALKAIPKVPLGKLDTDWNREKLEERAARSTNGPETEVLEGSALDEMTALLRTRRQKGILQVLASFHDLGYFYIASVSFLHILVPAHVSLTCALRNISLGEIWDLSFIRTGHSLWTVCGFMQQILYVSLSPSWKNIC